MFRGNHGPTLYRFRDKWRFQSKIAIFPTPCILCPRWKGSPRNWVSALGIKKTRMMELPGEKEVWRYLQPCGHNAQTWQTDGQMNGLADTVRQQRPRLRIASRGKKIVELCCHGSDWLFRIYDFLIASDVFNIGSYTVAWSHAWTQLRTNSDCRS